MDAPSRSSIPQAPVAVTMGEPAGIGGEILLKAWLARTANGPTFFAIDDPERLRKLATRLGMTCPIIPIAAAAEAHDVITRGVPVLPLGMSINELALGQPQPGTGKAVIASIDRAIALVRDGSASALVTNPIQKAVLQAGGFRFPGHTEYLGHLAGATPAMMLAVEGLRVVPVTVHMAVRDIAQKLTTDAIVALARITATALRKDFSIANPRLAVAALNPHAGENGLMGDEEQRLIAPAVERLRTDGIDVRGPAPADTLFHAAARTTYDAAICMYHDQALIPLKTIDFAGGVNVTLGLPFVRCSPDHGTALDIADRGIADATSFVAALHMAADIASRRQTVSQ